MTAESFDDAVRARSTARNAQAAADAALARDSADAVDQARAILDDLAPQIARRLREAEIARRPGPRRGLRRARGWPLGSARYGFFICDDGTWHCYDSSDRYLPAHEIPNHGSFSITAGPDGPLWTHQAGHELVTFALRDALADSVASYLAAG